jgi:hypothetical protein
MKIAMKIANFIVCEIFDRGFPVSGSASDGGGGVGLASALGRSAR